MPSRALPVSRGGRRSRHSWLMAATIGHQSKPCTVPAESVLLGTI